MRARKPCVPVSPLMSRNRRRLTKCLARSGRHSPSHEADLVDPGRLLTLVRVTVCRVRTFHYRWEWRLRSSPDALWPLVTDTNRFNRDVGVPHVERVGDSLASGRSTDSKGPGWQRLRLVRFGVPIEWEEEPFEWTRPSRFG